MIWFATELAHMEVLNLRKFVRQENKLQEEKDSAIDLPLFPDRSLGCVTLWGRRVFPE